MVLERVSLGRFAARTSAGLVGVVGAGVVFAVLLALVHGTWSPLDRLDRAVVDRLNGVVAGNDLTVEILKAVSGFGGRNMLGLVLLVGSGYLLIRRQRRLAAYAVLTTLGALILDPVVKLLVERLRPVVEVSVASAPGPSFPSGHALDSLVAYGVLLLVFLPTVPKRRRTAVVALVVSLIVLIGVTRILLGVHYLTDVLGGWALGVAWLGVTAAAFRRWRTEAGRPTAPVTDGLDPEAADELTATEEQPRASAHPLLTATELLVAAVLVVGVVFGAGYLVTSVLRGTAFAAADLGVVQWFAAHRAPGWTTVLSRLNRVGDTGWIITVTVAAGGLALAVYRRWRPVVFLWTTMLGEVLLFLVVSTVVTRSRPAVEHLQPHLPPTASFPSGHVAGAICLYASIALLVWHTTRAATWRTIAVAAAVLLPAGVAVARMYRGVHHPTDVAGSVLLAALWLTATWLVLRPTARSTAPADGPDGRGSAAVEARPAVPAGAAGVDGTPEWTGSSPSTPARTAAHSGAGA